MSPLISADRTNATVVVPIGTVNHGNPRLLCIPPKWYDYIIFLAANYLAHAATVVAVPGQSWGHALETAALALILPMSGLSRALRNIFSCGIMFSDPIQQAARAGALCIVAPVLQSNHAPRARRSSCASTLRAPNLASTWYNNPNERCEQQDPDDQYDLYEVIGTRLQVHGVYHLTDKWRLVVVPSTAPVFMREGDKASKLTLSCSYNIPKCTIGLLQAVWGVVTLYRARGDQVSQYGYAAFGLTMVQYAWMSIVNFIAGLLQPEYPAVYMIRTPLMDEAEQDGCYFSGDLKVQLGDGHVCDFKSIETLWVSLTFWGGILLGAVPLAVVLCVGGTNPQSSTPIQRGFTLAWIAISIAAGPLFSVLGFQTMYIMDWEHIGVRKTTMIHMVLAVPFIGGVVCVMLMLRDFGKCIHI